MTHPAAFSSGQLLARLTLFDLVLCAAGLLLCLLAAAAAGVPPRPAPRPRSSPPRQCPAGVGSGGRVPARGEGGGRNYCNKYLTS